MNQPIEPWAQPGGGQPRRPHGGFAPLPAAGQAQDWRYGPAPGQVPWQAPAAPAVVRASSPLTVSHVKISAAELPRMIAELQTLISKRRRNHILLCVVFAVLSVCLVVIPPVAVFGMIATAWYAVRGFRKLSRKQGKLDFLRGVTDDLRDELHPRCPVRFDFDLTAYDASSKLTRTARSAAGNTKSYYTDKWLRLRLVLADRTQVELVRQVGSKTKKGSTQYEKRRMFLTVRPNTQRYHPMQGQPAAHRLQREVEQAIVSGFHNRPEEVRVHVEHHTADIALRIVQWDAEILAREVSVVLAPVMNHLRERCAVAPHR